MHLLANSSHILRMASAIEPVESVYRPWASWRVCAVWSDTVIHPLFVTMLLGVAFGVELRAGHSQKYQYDCVLQEVEIHYLTFVIRSIMLTM